MTEFTINNETIKCDFLKVTEIDNAFWNTYFLNMKQLCIKAIISDTECIKNLLMNLYEKNEHYICIGDIKGYFFVTNQDLEIIRQTMGKFGWVDVTFYETGKRDLCPQI